MEINATTLDSVFKGFNTLFTRAKLAAQKALIWQKLAMEIKSTGEEEVYAELELLPRMREWLGDRHFHNVVANANKLKNRDFELSFELERNKISDDKIGLYAPLLEMWGMQAGRLPDDLITEAILGGTSAIVADGQYFFDTDHPVCPSKPALGTQANYVPSGFALNATNYEAARARMMGFKGEDNKPMGVIPNLLGVSPELEGMGKRLVLSDKDASGATNINQGTAGLLVIPELTVDPTGWYLFDTRWPIKPFIYQKRQDVRFVSATNPSDPEVFRRKKFQFGADGRAAGGYGPWWMAFKGKA